MKNNLIKIFGIFSGLIFLAGCASPFSGQKTEIKIENKEPEVATSETPEIVTESEKSQEKSPENIVEEKSNNAEQEAVSNLSKNNFKINDQLVSWGFSKANNRTIDTIIVHSSYNAVGSDLHDLDDIIYKEYKPYGVSPHYIISREGKVYRLVEDKNIAYHAGESKVPDGRTGVNSFSIGIEIVNTKSEKPNNAQYEAFNNLLAYLKQKYKIKYVLGHSDIAPGRKDDPWNFNWDKIK